MHIRIRFWWTLGIVLGYLGNKIHVPTFIFTESFVAIAILPRINPKRFDYFLSYKLYSRPVTAQIQRTTETPWPAILL